MRVVKPDSSKQVSDNVRSLLGVNFASDDPSRSLCHERFIPKVDTSVRFRRMLVTHSVNEE